ncbi:hypothetical protein IGS74_17375 [Aureimonas sp. OT7]|uniref:hypothetical protein n=1 Tax=Aureimonas sp. OT7 TaxID=2816454 RepID=UPI001785A944|nr:hypothetical protein [Aureimonas sp. OT7]QOG06282.1 hypothetical protein IGS74_17375 [Aureimonas sp. OT7]
MKTSSKLLAGLLATGIALPALAQTAQPAPPPPPPAAAGQDAKGPPHGPGGPGGPGRMMRGERPDRPSMLWDVASRLTAAETALGITAEQQDSWNAFTRAAIGFVEAGRPARGGPDVAAQDDEDEAGPASDDAAATETDDADEAAPTLPDSRPFARVDRMLERSIARGQAAETLRTAMAQLAGELTPEQTATAERLLRELPRPGRHGKGPHHHRPHGPGQERGDRR